MTQDIVRRELRRRGAVDAAKAKANKAAAEQAAKDAATPVLSPEERDKAVLATAAKERKELEALLKARPATGSDVNARQAMREHKQAQARRQADEDAKRPAILPDVKVKPGKPLTLQELNALSLRDRNAMRDDARDASKAAGLAVYTKLSGRGEPRGRHSKHVRAAAAQRELAEARARAEKAGA